MPIATGWLRFELSEANREQARTLLQEALDELQLTADTFPTIPILHASEAEEVRRKFHVKLKEQIADMLGLEVHFEFTPGDTHSKNWRQEITNLPSMAGSSCATPLSFS